MTPDLWRSLLGGMLIGSEAVIVGFLALRSIPGLKRA
jgi:hypothetical protein